VSQPNRREFAQQALGSLLTFSLLETLLERDAFADPVKPLVTRWVADVNDLGVELKHGRLSQLEWQQLVEQLFSNVELPELLKLIDFEKVVARGPLVDNGARRFSFRFTEVAGVPTKLVFGKQIFGLKEGRSVVPHGHNNMATAFLILKGDFHGRHYDRLDDEDDHIIIRPTIDRAFSVGDYSTVSDHKDNVHWFKAATEGSYIFNIHVLNLADDFPLPTGRVYVDPNGEQLAGEAIRAKRIGYKEAHRLYG